MEKLESENKLSFCHLAYINARTEEYPKHVTLITPPSVFLLDERVFVNLGILKVASVLEQAGIAVSHLDLSGMSNYLDALRIYLNDSDSEVFGITTTTPQLPTVVKVIHLIREIKPLARIILGGPHVTLTCSAVKLEKKNNRVSRAHESLNKLLELVDVLVSGDGEYAIFKAVMKNSERIIDADDPENGMFLSDEVYELTPLPARHLVDLATYKYQIEGHKSTSLIAQLGCPFSCGFCGGRNSKSLRQIRVRSVESIIGEIKMLYERFGYTGFMFYDDELNVNKHMSQLMRELITLQEKLGIEFRLRGFVKSQLFTQEQADLMYKAGFRWLLSGFESGSPRILENINKKATLKDNYNAIAYAKKAGLKVKALMSVGHPGECEETIIQTQQWLLNIEPEDFDCTIITTYPGTPYYDEAVPHETMKGVWSYTYKKTGDRLHAYEIDFMQVADYYKGDPNDGYQSFVFTDYLSSEQIVELRNWVETSVREKLIIPFPQSGVPIRYEHTFGQGFNQALPANILRQSNYEGIKKVI